MRGTFTFKNQKLLMNAQAWTQSYLAVEELKRINFWREYTTSEMREGVRYADHDVPIPVY